MDSWPSRKVRFVKAVSEPEADACRVSVELLRPESETFVGSAQCPSSQMDFARAGAQAAAQALVKAAGVGDDAAVRVEELELVSVCHRDVVIVSVTVEYRGRTRQLFGVCQLQDDTATAGALAVLNATNRVLDFA